MRILLVNKFHWLKGGSETYYFELGKLLKKHGHTVAYFAMQNQKNIKTGDREYFVKPFNPNSKNIFKAFETIYSKKNKQIMLNTLEDFKPDIVHINLFQRHLTYSIIEACKEKGIPVVLTAHDLQAVCPASAMLCGNKICEKCINSTKFHCAKNKCNKNSFLKSTLCSLESTIYQKKKVYDLFDVIITPSNFVSEKLKQDNIKANIKIIHNFVDIDNFNDKNNNDKNYAFYFGRLSIEKGIINLIKAFAKQKNGQLYIAGDGPEKNNIINYINKNKLNDRIKLLGFLSQEAVKKYISNSSFVVVPSICYENCPYSVLETFAMGKPVIGSKIGGIPEIIDNNENGYLYEYQNIKQLSTLIEKMFTNQKERLILGKKARQKAINEFSIEVYYNKLNEIYNSLKRRG